MEKLDYLSAKVEEIRSESEKMKALFMLDRSSFIGMESKIQKLEKDMLDCLLEIQELEKKLSI
jgi:hypothetical protein